MDPLGRSIVAFREVRRNLLMQLPEFFDESLVLGGIQSRTVLQRCDYTQSLITHIWEDSLIGRNPTPKDLHTVGGRCAASSSHATGAGNRAHRSIPMHSAQTKRSEHGR